MSVKNKMYYRNQHGDFVPVPFYYDTKSTTISDMTVKAETVWMWICPHCGVNDYAEIPKGDTSREFKFIVECDNCDTEIEVIVEN